MSSKFFKDRKESLEEVLTPQKGEVNLYSKCIEVPDQPVKRKIKNKQLVSDHNDIFKKDTAVEIPELTAIKMMIIEKITQEMKKKKLSQAEMIKRIGISKTTFMRALNPKDYSVSWLTLCRVATALGKNLRIRLIPKDKHETCYD